MSLDTGFVKYMPFPNMDVMEYSLQFMPLSSLGCCSAVCRAWSTLMDFPELWLKNFDYHKYPRIEDGHKTAKEDFRFMHQYTYSARKMAPLGQFVGEVPMISRETFKRMKEEMDPVEKTIKLHEKHRFLVQPTHIFRAGFNKALYDDLIANGDFNDRDLKDGGMMVPYSAKNLKVLSRHPLDGFTRQIFAFSDSHLAPIFNQCSKVAPRVNVSIIRIESPNETEERDFDEQTAWLQNHKYYVSSFTERLHYCMLEIFTTNTCSDSQGVVSRTSDLVKVTTRGRATEDLFPVAIGDFDPDYGITITALGSRSDNTRASASLPVEFPALKGPSSNGKRSYDAGFGNGN